MKRMKQIIVEVEYESEDEVSSFVDAIADLNSNSEWDIKVLPLIDTKTISLETMKEI